MGGDVAQWEWGFLYKHKEPELVLQIAHLKKKLSVVKVLVVPTLEMQRPRDPWGSKANPPIL